MREIEARKKVEPGAIERGLTELLGTNQEDQGSPVTKAALWNVIAHTDSDKARDHAGEVLGRASATVPHRSILIRSNPAEADSLDSWISANCHPGGEGKEVCSEQIIIAAGGERVLSVPSLVQALLIPDMPVAAWWLGDLPNERESYVEALLEPADRFIVDSLSFDRVADLELVGRLGSGTESLPADLNWMRLDEWRLAAASLFDPLQMRQRVRRIRGLRLVSSTDGTLFGHNVEALYFAAWLAGRTVGFEGNAAMSCDFEGRVLGGEVGALCLIEISFDDDVRVVIERSSSLGVLRGRVEGVSVPSTVTPLMARDPAELIVRQLSHQDEDRIFSHVLPAATALAQRLA